MYKIILLALSFCLFPFSVLANEKMDNAANALLPLVFDANQYTKADASEQLNKQLSELQFVFQQASFKNMLAHVEQAQKHLENKNETKAREQIKLMLTFCLACNPNTSYSHKDSDLSSMRFASNFEFAEYNYTTQNYQAAVTYYDQYLTDKKQHKSKEQTKLALERLLSIYTQLEKDPSVAAAYLNEYNDYIHDHPELKVTLQQWIHDLNNLNGYFNETLETRDSMNFDTIQEYVTRFISTQPEHNVHPETDKVKRMVLKGMAFNYLNEARPSEKEKPLLLDWLALSYEP